MAITISHSLKDPHFLVAFEEPCCATGTLPHTLDPF
jgi:hypothetical protein